MKIGHVEIIYYGQCPLCSSWVRMTRLRLRADSVELIDARSDHPRVETLAAMSYNLDAGMILRCAPVDSSRGGGDAHACGIDR